MITYSGRSGDWTMKSKPTTGISSTREARSAASRSTGCSTGVMSWMVPPVWRLAVLRTRTVVPAAGTLSSV